MANSPLIFPQGHAASDPCGCHSFVSFRNDPRPRARSYRRAECALPFAGKGPRDWRQAFASRLPEGFVEGVAGSADGSDGVALAAPRERLAQAPDMDVDRAFVDLRRLAPHAVEELRAREHPARLLQKIFAQPELGRAEVDVANPAPHPPRLPVEIEIAGIETLGDPLGP